MVKNICNHFETKLKYVGKDGYEDFQFKAYICLGENCGSTISDNTIQKIYGKQKPYGERKEAKKGISI